MRLDATYPIAARFDLAPAVPTPEAAIADAAAPGFWPRATGLLGATLLHLGLMAAVLAWRPPAAEPPPITVELVAIEPAMPELPLPDPPDLTPLEALMPPAPPEPAAVPDDPPVTQAPTEPEPEPRPEPEPEPVSTPEPAPVAAPPPPPKPRPKPTQRRPPVIDAAPSPTTAEAPQAPAIVAPIQAAPAPPVATVAPAVQDAAYLATLLRHLEQHRDYPRSARLRRIEGRAVVQLALARDGRLLEARIERSAGHDVLDAAALDTVRRAAPLPRVPAELPGERIVLRVPFIYRLNPSAAPE